MKIKVINKSKHDLPKYQTAQSAGMDLYANIEAPVTLQSLERRIIPTGLFIELPVGYEAQVRPRSGLAFKNGVTCLNSPEQLMLITVEKLALFWLIYLKMNLQSTTETALPSW